MAAGGSNGSSGSSASRSEAPGARLPAPAGVLLRASRALAFATVCTVISACGHALAGGGPVPVGVAALAAGVAFGAAYLLGDRERGLDTIFPAALAAQSLAHELFARAGPPEPAVPASPGHGHPGPGMLLAHLTVALLTAWWMHRGESALWLMARLWGAPPPRPRLLAPVPPAPVRVGPLPLAPRPTPSGGQDAPATAIRRRGPPSRRSASRHLPGAA